MTLETHKQPTIVDDFIAPPCTGKIDIVYRDHDFLLIDKPSGLLSLSGKNPANLDSVHHRLVQGVDFEAFETATLLHRLDFGTSGLMLVALNKATNALLTKQFQARSIDKRYIAVLEGQIAADEGVIEGAIARDPALFPRVKICQQTGKSARSHYRVIERLADSCRVEFTPLTGRTHQLRIHSLSSGHPILGCDLYNSADSEEKAPRLLLHASQLAFDHPISGERMTVDCDCPF